MILQDPYLGNVLFFNNLHYFIIIISLGNLNAKSSSVTWSWISLKDLISPVNVKPCDFIS